MKWLSGALAALAALAAVGAIGWIVMHGYAFSAENARIVYDDVERFETLVPQLPAADPQRAQFLGQNYVSTGTRGLRAFRRQYGLSGESLSAMIGPEMEKWTSCRLSPQLRQLEPEIRRGMARFETLYRGVLFPPTYFIVGNEIAGGMNGAAGVVISAEVHRAGVPGCDAAGRARSITTLPCLVMHELVHFNHAKNTPVAYARRWNNLERAIKEGAADFIAELSIGCHTSEEAHGWARPREAALWEEFRQLHDSRDTGTWFWVDPEGDRPQDLGYFIGYKIVRAYYERADDKQQAVRRILNISDYQAFLAESGYAGGG